MHCSQPREKQNRVHDFLVFLICFHLQQVRKGYSARNLFRLLFYFLEFFLYNRNTVFRTISESLLLIFFSWLQCVKQEFTFKKKKKIRRSVLVIYKLELALDYRYFTNNVTTSSEKRYWKIHLNGYFWGQSFSKNIPEWLLLKGNCDNIFILKVLMATHILNLLPWRHVKEKRILF